MRYLLIAGSLYYLFWIRKPQWTERSKIQLKTRHNAIPKTELLYSMSTVVLTSFWGVFLFWVYNQGYFLVYTDINGFWGYAYIAFSIYMAMLIHDTYFYWAHRLMHTKTLFHYVHAIHHKSMNPTPFAAFSFHPLEAIFEIFFLLPLLMIMPMHVSAVFIFLFFTFVFNVAGHLGHELNPKGMWDNWWGRWLTTPTHHNLHHQLFNCNYALYYRYWDVWFKTLHASTGKVFKDIKAR
ncbi:MAG: sterol desaturase family protein [Bdellovibrionaceae bacterium]|nr:sterol desaturase family protein [Pseudobdellovibrionaceae bacterium]